MKEISYEYIRGLVDGEGTFTFSPNKYIGTKTPTFAIRMHERDEALITMVRDRLNLKNEIYKYHYRGNDSSNRGPTITLIVREIGNLKNIIVPLFYKKLLGNKGRQFEVWIEKIGSDDAVPRSYKFIYKLYKSGYYDKISKFD